MKVAIASNEGFVARHFGKCQEYIIFDVSGGNSGNLTYVPNPGHQPGFLPQYLKGLNVDCIIAGEMSQKVVALFKENNIKTVVGISGPIYQVMNDVVAGKLVSG